MKYAVMTLMLYSCTGCVTPREETESVSPKYEAVFPVDGIPKAKKLYVCGLLGGLIKCLPLEVWLRYQESQTHDSQIREESSLERGDYKEATL